MKHVGLSGTSSSTNVLKAGDRGSRCNNYYLVDILSINKEKKNTLYCIIAKGMWFKYPTVIVKSI